MMKKVSIEDLGVKWLRVLEESADGLIVDGVVVEKEVKDLILQLDASEKQKLKEEHYKKIKASKERLGSRSGRLPISAVVVQRIKEMRLEGYGIKEITDCLHTDGVKISIRTVKKYCAGVKKK